MSEHQDSPWYFGNAQAPMGEFVIEYDYLSEIAMGSPLAGVCFLHTPNGARLQLHDFAAGPAIWNASGTRVAFPGWTPYRQQQLCLVDIMAKTLTVFTKIFRVLEIKECKGDHIIGVDSPIFQPIDFSINIHEEDKQSITPLVF
ncbi:MAG: hypothetical protein AAFY71_08890 [Bacteroidota bacterium]